MSRTFLFVVPLSYQLGHGNRLIKYSTILLLEKNDEYLKISYKIVFFFFKSQIIVGCKNGGTLILTNFKSIFVGYWVKSNSQLNIEKHKVIPFNKLVL
jgi:hypothetical protein